MIQKIAILGLGLIGGSLSLALRKHRSDLHLTGFDTPAVLDEARRRNVVDVGLGSPTEAVADADLVVLATPLGPLMSLLETIAPALKPGALVTDVGSVKGPVLARAGEVLPEHCVFIGGHPMAGSEKNGVAHADPFLFENATYVLCPPEPISETDIARDYPDFLAVLGATGARILVMDAARHDRIAAAVSHLPQLLSVTLMNFVGDLHEDDGGVLRLAAGGFRDMTRIASSSFDMWRDILVANEGPILDMLGGFAAALQKTRNRVFSEDMDAMRQFFADARARRDTIPKTTKGFLHPLADVYVYAEDKPGFLFHLTRVLHEASVNIKDLELLKIREGIEGVFRIGFADQPTAETAMGALGRAGYTTFQM
ncbi:MAG: prephenate dehydrogenase [Rhodothermales bacterium]